MFFYSPWKRRSWKVSQNWKLKHWAAAQRASLFPLRAGVRRLVLLGEKEPPSTVPQVFYTFSPQDKVLWEPWLGRQPTHIPGTLPNDFGQQEEEQLRPLSSFPGKGVGIHITMRMTFPLQSVSVRLCPSNFCTMMLSFVISWEWEVWL